MNLGKEYSDIYCAVFSKLFYSLIGLREKIDYNNDNDILDSLQFTAAYFHIYCEFNPFKVYEGRYLACLTFVL